MHFDDSSQIQNTPDSPFSEPFPDSTDFHEKTLQGSPTDIPQIVSWFAEIIAPCHRRGNEIIFAAA